MHWNWKQCWSCGFSNPYSLLILCQLGFKYLCAVCMACLCVCVLMCIYLHLDVQYVWSFTRACLLETETDVSLML